MKRKQAEIDEWKTWVADLKNVRTKYQKQKTRWMYLLSQKQTTKKTERHKCFRDK